MACIFRLTRGRALRDVAPGLSGNDMTNGPGPFRTSGFAEVATLRGQRKQEGKRGQPSRPNETGLDEPPSPLVGPCSSSGRASGHSAAMALPFLPAGASATGINGTPSDSRTLFSISSGQLRIVLQEVARVLLALADALAVVGVPGAGLLDDLGLDADVEELALAADAVAVEDVELDLA